MGIILGLSFVGLETKTAKASGGIIRVIGAVIVAIHLRAVGPVLIGALMMAGSWQAPLYVIFDDLLLLDNVRLEGQP